MASLQVGETWLSMGTEQRVNFIKHMQVIAQISLSGNGQNSCNDQISNACCFGCDLLGITHEADHLESILLSWAALNCVIIRMSSAAAGL